MEISKKMTNALKEVTNALKEVTNEPVIAVIRCLDVGCTFTRGINKIESTRQLVFKLKDEEDNCNKVFSVERDRVNNTCIITRKK